MIEFFIKQHKLINLLIVGVFIIGVYYFINGQKEGFPNIGLDQIYITTSYSGASAKDVETLITRKIEDAIESVEGIDDILSSTAQGLSTIIVFADTVSSGLILKDVERKIKDEIDIIKKDLPADLKNDPVVRSITFGEIIPIIQVYLTGEEDLNILKKITEDFRNDIREIKGVSKTEKINFPKSQVWVSVDPAKLKRYDIDISEVVQSISAANINVPSGSIKTNNEEILVKTLSSLNNVADVENVIIRGNDNFQFVRVKDLARSEITPEELETLVEVDAKTGIGVSVFKSLNGDIIKVATAVKTKIEEYKKQYPNLNIFYVDDQSFYVERRLSVLGNNASIGLLLVFLCLIMFFEFRVTIWTVIGIPVAFCFAIIAAYQIGITLNLMSMFGFIIVLGMLVDDAIIVSENIYQKYEKGMPIMQASIEGAKEMFIPILAITCTTIAAFLPLITLPGIFGKVLGIIPQVVIIAMIASFIEAILCLPGHIAHMKDKRSKKKSILDTPSNELINNFHNSVFNLSDTSPPAFAGITDGTAAHTNVEKDTSNQYPYQNSQLTSNTETSKKIKKHPKQKRNWFNRLKSGYVNLLNKITQRPLLYTFIIVSFFISIVVGLGSQIPFVFFPGETETIMLNIETDKSSALSKTQLIIRDVERNLRKSLENDITDFISTIGRTKEQDNARNRVRSYVGNIQLNISPLATKTPSEITKIAQKTLLSVPGVEEFSIFGEAGGPPPGNPVEIILYFNDISLMPEVYTLGLKIKDYVTSISNTTSEVISYEEGKEEIVISPNPRRVNAFGVGLDKFTTIPGTSFKGNISTTINNFENIEEEVEVIVKLDEEKVTLASITNIQLKNRLGKNLSMGNIANISKTITTGQISKENGRFTIKITAQLEDDQDKEYTAQTINDQILTQFDKWNTEIPQIDITMGGAQKEQNELLRGAVIALLLSIFGVLLVLVAVFKSYSQPLVIMSILPFITVGVVIGLYINNVPLGLMPLLGVVALVGVVVNDSLVMVDLINRKRLLSKSKRSLREVVVESASDRLRPILMTTITTVVGLTPIAYGIGGSEPFIAPMAISFLWGMLFSTLVILFLIPNIYLIIDRISRFVYRILGNESRFND